MAKNLFDRSLSHQHTCVETSKKIYKTRRVSLNLYEEITKLENRMDLPRSVGSLEVTGKLADSSVSRYSDMFHNVGIAADDQSQFCGMIGDYLHKQIQVNDSFQVSAVQGH